MIEVLDLKIFIVTIAYSITMNESSINGILLGNNPNSDKPIFLFDKFIFTFLD